MFQLNALFQQNLKFKQIIALNTNHLKGIQLLYKLKIYIDIIIMMFRYRSATIKIE